VIESLDSDGDIHVYDVSKSSDGGEIEPAKALELIEWARASVLALMVYSMIQAFEQSCDCDEDDCCCGGMSSFGVGFFA